MGEPFIVFEEDFELIDPVMTEVEKITRRPEGIEGAQLALLIGGILAQFPSLDEARTKQVLDNALRMRTSLLADMMNDND